MAHAHPDRVPDVAERIALAATFACLVHCVGLPLVMAALPALATIVPVPETFHLAALALAIPATGYALGAGYRAHGLAGPLLAGLVGLVFLTLGATTWGGGALEAPGTVVGSLLIAAAHITNWRLRRR